MKFKSFLILVAFVPNLEAFQDREKEIAKAIIELGDNDAEVRQAAEKRLIELDADNQVEALVKETKDAEIIDRGNRIIRLVKLNKRIGKALWKNDPSFADSMASENEGSWLSMLRKKLAENPEVLKYPDTTLFSKEFLKDEKLAIELLNKNRVKDCWWFFIEAIDSSNDKIRAEARSFFIMPDKGVYSPFTDQHDVISLVVEILLARIEKAEMLHAENEQVLRHVFKFTKKEVQAKAFERLIKLLERSDPKKRISSISVLNQELDQSWQKSLLEDKQLIKLIDLLLQLVSDEKDSAVRSHAISAVNWHISTHDFFQLPLDKSAKELLEKSVDRLLAVSDHKDSSLRQPATMALFVARKLNSDQISKKITEAMLKQMSDTEAIQRDAIHIIFGMFYRLEQKLQDKIVKILLEKLTSKDKFLREKASNILYVLTAYPKLAKKEEIIRALVASEKKGEINLYSKFYFASAYDKVLDDEKESKGRHDIPCQIAIDHASHLKQIKDDISSKLKAIQDSKGNSIEQWRHSHQLRYKIYFLNRDLFMPDSSSIKEIKDLLAKAKKELEPFEQSEADYIQYEAKQLTKALTEEIDRKWENPFDKFKEFFPDQPE